MTMRRTKNYLFGKIRADKKKISAAEAVYNQAAAQVKYLEEVLKVERLLPAMFGVGRQTPMQQATTNKGRWQALVKQVVAVQEYIGKPSDGRMLDAKYWTEAIDPMHTHWKNPQNHPVFQKWVDLRHNEKATIRIKNYARCVRSDI